MGIQKHQKNTRM